MPRFPDYDAEIGQGLQLPAPGPSEVPPEAAAYQARIARQNAFDDEERFSQRRLQRQAELDEAAGAMPPGATGFAAGVMRSTQKGDSALLAAISPANRPAFAARLAADREALLGQAAVMEQQGRARYEAGELDNAFAINEQDVARDPSLLATARQAYFGLVDSSGQTPAQKAQRRQDAERGFAIAAWRSRFADDPEAGAAALGQDAAAGGTSGDPAFAAIPKAEHGRLIGDAFLRRDQNQALARGTLDPIVRDAETALTSIGRYDGALPDETRFTAAYGREEGPRRHGEFQRIVRLGADVDAIKAMTPAEQTAWLARFAPKGSEFTGNGADFAEGRERHARAVQAIALNLAARHKNPNAYVRAVYPALDRLWSEAESSPERLKAALAATNAAMDGLGLPAQGRAVLPKAMIDKALMRFVDTARPLSERLAPFRALITAPDDPAQQANLFAQAMLTGLPRLAAPALAAYGRGEDDSAARLLAAAFGDHATQSATRAKSDLVGSLDPLTAMLYDRLVQHNLVLNGGDLANAHALAGRDIRLPAPTLVETPTAPVVDISEQPGIRAGNDRDGSDIPASSSTTANNLRNPTTDPSLPADPATEVTETRLPASPNPSIDNSGQSKAENSNAKKADLASESLPGINPINIASPLSNKAPPSSSGPLPSLVREILLGSGGNRGAHPIGMALFDGANKPQNASENYPNSPVPQRFSLSPFGGTHIPPAISSYIQQQIEALPLSGNAERDAIVQAKVFADFNIAFNAARRDRLFDQGYSQYYNAGGLDISFAPQLAPNGDAVVVAVRENNTDPTLRWIRSRFGLESDPPGPWWGTPAPATWQEAYIPRPDALLHGKTGLPDAPAEPRPTTDVPPTTPGQPEPIPALQPPPAEIPDIPSSLDLKSPQAGRRGDGVVLNQAVDGTNGESPPPASKNKSPPTEANGQATPGRSSPGRGPGNNKVEHDQPAAPPQRVTLDTDWVRDFHDELPRAKKDWADKAARYQKETGKTLPQPKVFSITKSDGPPIYSVNQTARLNRGGKDRETLATESVRERDAPIAPGKTRSNETMFDAHSELYGLEELHAQGRTEGQSLKTVVFGDALCKSCRRHLPYAAEKAKLKEWTIYEQTTQKTLYWKSGDTAFTVLK